MSVIPPAGATARNQPDPYAMSTRALDKPYDALLFIAETIKPHVEHAPGGDGQQRVDWLEYLSENGANFVSADPVLLSAFGRLALNGPDREAFLSALQKAQAIIDGLEQPQAENG